MDECVYIQRCVAVDDYMGAPIPALDDTACPLSRLAIRKVPVLRVYGATQLGQKGCVHIHRVFPYLMIPLRDIPGQVENDFKDIFTELEECLNRSYGSSNGQFIHNIIRAQGIPFYGFHESEIEFLKILFYQPRYVKRTAELLLQGCLRGKLVQPHEAHFPYSLQFLTDYNIHGMNLIYFNRLLFRVSEEQFNHLTINERTDYLSTIVDMNEVPQKHMLNPIHCTKKCASALELDVTADAILNVNFIDVNCNPGIKAICEEERQRRHQAGNFTPMSKKATPPRKRVSLPQTKRWEDKLEHIIGDSSCISPLSQSSDPDVLDFLLHLNATQPSQSLSVKSLSQEKSRANQLNLSLHCEDEQSASSSDEEQQSIMMTQRVFYDEAVDDNCHIPGTHDLKKSEEIDSNDGDFDEISTSQLLQLDGNADTNNITIRKRKRLGCRPSQDVMLPNMAGPSNVGMVLRSSKGTTNDVDKVAKSQCTRLGSSKTDAKTPPGKQTRHMNREDISQNDHSSIHTQSSTSLRISSSKHVTSVPITPKSPSLRFNVSQFDDLKSSPSSRKQKRYQSLRISSGIREESSCSDKQKAVCSKEKSPSSNTFELSTTPVKTDLSQEPEKKLFAPKDLFPKGLLDANASPRTKILNVIDTLVEEDHLSINSFNTASTKSLSSVSSSQEKTPLPTKSKALAKKSMIMQSEEKMGLNDKIMMWLSESECSQDESETLPADEPKRYSMSLSINDSVSYSPKSPELSQNTDLNRIQSNAIDNSKKVKPYVTCVIDNSDSSPETLNCSKLLKLPQSQISSGKSYDSSLVSLEELSSGANKSKLSVASPVCLTSPSCTSKQGPTQETLSPAIDDKSCSLFSTLKNIEFDSSLFFSQYQLEEGRQDDFVGSSHSFKYNVRQPPVADCIEYVRQSLSDNDISTVMIPHYSTPEDAPGPTVIGSKRIHFEHSHKLPDQIFFPECEEDLGVLGLESWEDMICKDHTKSKEKTVTLRYAVRAPVVSGAKDWLSQRRKKSSDSGSLQGSQKKGQSESLPVALSSTPLCSNIKLNFSSLPDKFMTPIPMKNPISKFKKKIKFSPKNDSLSAPISPTLFINSHISEESNNDSSKFGMTVPMGDCTKSHVVQHLTVLSLEVYASAVGDKLSNPRYDPALAVFYALYSDNSEEIREGSFCVCPPNSQPKCVPEGLVFVDAEEDLFQRIFKLVHEHDPDLITGYEIKKSSLGYLIERANNIGLNFQANISRFPEETKDMSDDSEGTSNWWVTVTNEVQLAGRVIINLWRLMRTEVNLTNYSFESVAYHVLHERFPKLPQQTLEKFYADAKLFSNFADYFIVRTRGNLRLLLDLNILVRTSEMGRLFGIEFFNVLSRGSQYRVESMMSRLAKPLNYVSISPSPDQRATMAAPEFIPLVMEPESKFYGDPVVVLDFQSLYPSMIIAYNMCFSTCLGRVNYLGTYGSFPFGASNLNITPNCLKKYKDHLFVSPCGVAFVNQSVRRGILPMMLNEILETRIMVKQMMKQHKDDKALFKMLDARQLALKLIANVTYGYTSANFSGRMPCIEIGDSIVAKGRETLESAIELVNNTPKWGGRVVYGDTDSLFILFKGCSKEDAFKRGQEIADVVTELNPKPVKLKFEKVYYPCVLQTKKRYVGMKYESVDDLGEYEAKGIETVRRDGCPASVKTLKQALHILFTTRDLSGVKKFLQNQFTKIAKNRISVQDFIFAKEYRGRDSYRSGACVPALEIAKRRLKNDPRSEPLVGERVQYLICYGTPGLPLIQLVHEPSELLFTNNLYLNSIYYITKAIIPALQRVFGLMGVNVLSWYNELPKDLRMHFVPSNKQSKYTLSHYYHTKHCPFCDKVSDSLCECYLDQQKVGVLMNSELSLLSDKLHSLYSICTDCTNTPTIIARTSVPHSQSCINFTCPVMFKRVKLCNQISDKEGTRSEVCSLYNW